LEDAAFGFKKVAEKLKWAMCCKNAKWTAILIFTILTILTVIIVIAVCTSDPKACESN